MLNTSRKARAVARLIVIALAIASLGWIVPFATLAEEIAAPPEPTSYVYFDLSAGNVTISGKNYTGYRYDGNTTAQKITGTLGSNEGYYVYQSNGDQIAANKQTGYINGELILPEHNVVMHGTDTWSDYVTDAPSKEGNGGMAGAVGAVIDAWKVDAAAAGRKSTGNRIEVTGQVGKSVLVIDNIWSTYAEKNTGRTTSGISFIPGSITGSDLTIRFKGDNRVGAIHYSNAKHTTVNGITVASNHLILESYTNTNADSITVANQNKNVNDNYWNAAIGSSDSFNHGEGIVINSGTVFAGTTTGDDCTAIGGGGNGLGIIDIKGGRVTAVVASSGAAIGGGIGKTSAGGQAVVTITGGEVYAYNNSCTSGSKKSNGTYTYSDSKTAYIPAAAIGGGSSGKNVCEACYVTITGGTVYATSVGGTAIGGGSSADKNGGTATVTIGGTAEVYAKSIGGTIAGQTVPPGVAIGGGTGGGLGNGVGNGGNVTLNVSGEAILRTGSIGGGSTIGINNGNIIGNAVVNITGGDISGQIIMAGGAKNKCVLKMSGGLIDNSPERVEGYTFKQSNGGAVYMDDTKGEATVSGGIITHCSAGQGGAVWMTGGTFTLSGTAEISECTADEIGGAVYLGGGTLNITGGSIHNSTAQSGGAVYMGGGTLNVSGGEIHTNQAIDGAGAYLANGTMIMSDGLIYNNNATQNGGGIYMGGGTLTISDGEIHTNQATDGAGAYLANGELFIEGGDIHHNTATNGAGVYLANGEMNMSGGTIGYNEAVQNGGGAYLGGGELNISGTTVMQYNTATNGAGAYVSGGDVEVRNGTIINNTASQNGGGLFVQNGSYYMVGGHIDHNKAVVGQGGGVFITTAGKDVQVDVRSGSISYNTAGIQGGAISVDCDRNNLDHVTVNIGVNEHHTINGEIVSADHDEDSMAEDNHCPVMQGNVAPQQAGAIFVKGGNNTVLNVYCLREFESEVTDVEDSKSVFMKVEGGKVNMSTADMESDPIDHHAMYGYINIQNTVHVTSGEMHLYGLRDNPMFIEDITVDVVKGEGGFYDHRPSDEELYVLIYYENYRDPVTNIVSGQYTVRQYHKNDVIFISGVIYQHPGHEIDGWFTEQNGTGNKYEVGWKTIFTGEYSTDAENETYTVGDLIVYAKWSENGYEIHFLPNPHDPTDEIRGEMPNINMVYGVYQNLPKNQYVYKGYVFLYWMDAEGTVYTDGQLVGNLAKEDGTVIELKACWDECQHLAHQVTFTYSASNNQLIRTCSCLAYWQTATVTANSATYDGNEHGANDIVFKAESENAYKPNNEWILLVSYKKYVSDTEPPMACSVPVNAGTYYAVLTEEGAEALYPYVINKATQAAPGVPTYTAEEGNSREITISPAVTDTPESWQYYEYRLRYLSGDSFVDEEWNVNNVQTMDMIFTSYFIYIRYGETENYLPSSEIMAQNVFYFGGGDVAIYLNSEFGLFAWAEHNEDIAGINIHIIANDGFYRSHVTVGYTAVDEDGDTITGMKLERKSNALYNLSDIPSDQAYTITITIEGVRLITKVEENNVTENQIFQKVNGDSAEIGCDSAYTAYYKVVNYYAYNNLQLRFTNANGTAAMLPKDTTVILLDLSNRSYWYYRINASTSSVLLENFVEMGGTANFVPPTETADLEYVFVVDFSQTADGYTTDTLLTELYAAANRTLESEVPDFEEKPVSVTLSNVTFDITNTSTSAGTEQQLTVIFANTSAVASKWDNRNAALVLRPLQILPDDARIDVSVRADGIVRSATYFLNAEGVFIIPISNMKTDLTVTFKTDMNGAGTTEVSIEYLFEAALYGAYSKAAQSPLNGELLMDPIRLTFVKVIIPEVSLKITSQNPVCTLNGVLEAQIEYDIPENYTIWLRLLRKNDIPDETGNVTGEYGDTGLPQTNIMESNGWRPDATASNRGTLALSLGGQSTGSYELVLTVRDDTGSDVKAVSYYFIIANLG